MIGRSKMIEMLQIMTSNRMLTPKILFLEKKIHLIFIRVNELLLYFSHIMARTSYISMRWWWYICFVLKQHSFSQLDIYSAASSLKQNVVPLGHIILISRQPVSALPPYCCGAQWRSNKYQFHSLWFDPTGARTHDL